jgi:lipoate-protein ligase B
MVRRVQRGGDVTYHGPGQLMGYPILNLRHHRKDVGWYVNSLKTVLVRALADFGIDAVPGDGRETGVWIGNDKIAAIGARIEDWVSFHGFALYVDPIMSHFDLIVPCGFRDKGITSMRQVMGAPVAVADVAPVVARQFASVFGVTLQEVGANAWADLGSTLSDVPNLSRGPSKGIAPSASLEAR